MDHDDDSTALTTTDEPGALDAHGFDPAAYDWVPVRRAPRADGWSAEKQRLFIGTLADTGAVRLAARAVGMSAKSAYALRRAPDGAGFDRAWSAAIRQAMNRLVDVCLERALEGSENPIFDKHGRVIAHRVQHHDRLAMFLLRAHQPELFRDAHRADRVRGEALPPAPEPVAEAVKALDPVPPAAPHTLMAPEELDHALDCADALPGKLPPWRRDADLVLGEREEARWQAEERQGGTPPDSLGAGFETALEAAKDGTWQPPRQPRGKAA